MCTVSFIARKRGYLLAMNRDEKLTRPVALAPEVSRAGGHSVLCPSEPNGGTWIALNDAGVTFALINWHSVKTPVRRNPVSRGRVVQRVKTSDVPGAASSVLQRLPLKQMNPFRLIGVFPAQRKIIEWRWNLKKLTSRNRVWQMQQWVSSGFDEAKAQRLRRKLFRRALRQASAGTLAWLRRLHRSHGTVRGPFSICMHRDDAVTVSYTEVSVFSRRFTMCYRPGPPCYGRGPLTPGLESVNPRS
jgi:hypothetical protein